MALIYDTHERATAAQLARDNPRWHIWWGVGSQRYHAVPGWPTAAAAIIGGPDPATLLLHMKEIEAKDAPPTSAETTSP